MTTAFRACTARLRILALVALLGAVVGPAAFANDRPFQVARTAIWEDDDDLTWSFESWAQRFGSVRGLSIEPEYTFGGGRSVQVELARFVDRDQNETGHEGEIEFKQLFKDIVTDGWGWGVSAAYGVQRSQGEGTVRTLGLKLPISIALGAKAYLHLDPGFEKASGARRAWTTSGAIEGELFERTTVFAELAHEGELRFGQVGVRHWLRREKLAIDFALQQQRTEGRRGSGVIIGIGVYDF